jgi:hypothetical protein
MTDVSHLAEQHIREQEARLHHIDELMERAQKGTAKAPEFAHIYTELDDLIRRRNEAAVQLDDFKARAAGKWQEEEIEQSGLMGIWDALAQQLERLVEKLERKG